MGHKISETMILTDEEAKQLKNTFAWSPFNSANGSDYIACVGINGGYGTETIFDGFASAVKTLINSIGEYENQTDHECVNQADPMVYPVLYCVRHSIELFLKISYDQIFLIKKIKDNKTLFLEIIELTLKIKELEKEIQNNSFAETEDEKRKRECNNQTISSAIEEKENALNSKWEKLLSNKADNKTHNLKEIYDNIISIYSTDERIKYAFDKISFSLKFFLEKDPDGDMFRYLADNKGNSHFITNDIQHVDLEKVGEQFEWMQRFFEDFLQNLSVIKGEYETTTYTSKLSRQQIKEISYILPKPDAFNEKIKEVKDQVMSKYNLSSSDFDRAVKIIKNHPEFSLNCGKEIILCEISQPTLDVLIDCIINNKPINYNSKIPLDESYALLTYNELGRTGSNYYSEDYNYVCKDMAINESKLNIYSPIVEIQKIIKGMRLCGQKTYADILENGLKEKSM